jgi:hypothetical protein
VEVNLREGGTSHPFGALRLLTGGCLDERDMCFTTPSGQVKYYFMTDRLEGPNIPGMRINTFLDASSAAGLDWNPRSQTGAVYFMLRGLEHCGRIGVVTIGNSPEHAESIYLDVVRLIHRLDADSGEGSCEERFDAASNEMGQR